MKDFLYSIRHVLGLMVFAVVAASIGFAVCFGMVYNSNAELRRVNAAQSVMLITQQAELDNRQAVISGQTETISRLGERVDMLVAAVNSQEAELVAERAKGVTDKVVDASKKAYDRVAGLWRK